MTRKKIVSWDIYARMLRRGRDEARMLVLGNGNVILSDHLVAI
jgi:hypothetical protein